MNRHEKKYPEYKTQEKRKEQDSITKIEEEKHKPN